MAVSKEQVTVGYEELEGEYKACRQHLLSKEQALRILQEELKKADLNSQRLKQEIKQLRSQLSRSQQVASPQSKEKPIPKNTFSLLNEELVHEKEMLVEQLETAHGHASTLERQLQLVEDEKEELANEKQHFATKCETLVKCLEEERSRQPPSHSTLQTLLDENRQLRLALVEAEADRDNVKGKIDRYKRAVERKNTIEAAKEQVVSMPDRKQDLKLAQKRISELETLANSLSQSVKEKSVTITHQKKANKMLATKVTELEHELKVLTVSQMLCGNGATASETSKQAIWKSDVSTTGR